MATCGSGKAVDWRVSGSYFEACNCEAICPCRSVGGRPGGPSTFGECFGALSWHVHQGHANGTDLSNLQVVMSIRYLDRLQPSTPWEVVLYVDRAADDDQRAAIADIFLGRAGGTVGRLYGPAIGEVHVVRSAQITLEHVAPRKRIGVVGYLTVEAEGDASAPATSGAVSPVSTTPAPSFTVKGCGRPIRNCAGKCEDGATPPSLLTSTTDLDDPELLARVTASLCACSTRPFHADPYLRVGSGNPGSGPNGETGRLVGTGERLACCRCSSPPLLRQWKAVKNLGPAHGAGTQDNVRTAVSLRVLPAKAAPTAVSDRMRLSRRRNDRFGGRSRPPGGGSAARRVRRPEVLIRAASWRPAGRPRATAPRRPCHAAPDRAWPPAP